MDILATIIKHNLSVRRIPDKIRETFDIAYFKEGDEITHYKGRKFCSRYKIPTHAGWFLCKPVNNTYSGVDWSFKKDNLAPSLEESIQLFLDSNNAPNK